MLYLYNKDKKPNGMGEVIITIIVTQLFVWRKQNSLTQRAAAERLGLPHFIYRLLEKGRLRPTAREWDALRSQFGREADCMLDGAPQGRAADK